MKKQFLSLLQKQVKGIIISTVSDDTSWIEEVNTDDVTVVAIEQPLHTPTHRVCFNYYGGGYMAARYLVGMGHRDIAFISPPLTYASRRQRLRRCPNPGRIVCLTCSRPIKRSSMLRVIVI